MRGIVERSIAAINRRLVLLAPPGADVEESSFRNITAEPSRHASLLHQAQRLRGSIYLNDGALQTEQLSTDGRHQTPEDERAWHLLFTNGDDDVTSCLWYLQHDPDVRFEDLRISRGPLAQHPVWRDRVRVAVEADLALARAEGLRYSEAGGWAAAKESHCPCDGLLLAMAAFSLSRRVGSPRVMATATHRHSSADILRRLGGGHFHAGSEELPGYYDPRYGCGMELLRFDTRKPERKYSTFIEMLQHALAHVPVVSQMPLAVSVPAAAPSVFSLWDSPMMEPAVAF